MNHLKRYTLAALAMALFAGPAHAGIVGGSSDDARIKEGASAVDAVDPNDPTKKRHIKGQRPGIAAKSIDIKKPVDFATLQRYAPANSHGVSSLSYNAKYMPSTHAKMGVFNFAKVSGADVYFGEWSKKGEFKDGTHTVYYAGDDSGTTVPTSGRATYAVKGISNYGSKGLLSGTFAADFMGRFVTGSLSNGKSGADKFSLNIGTVTILGTQLSGNGARANYGNEPAVTNGVVRGHFFGANAKALAGLPALTNRDPPRRFPVFLPCHLPATDRHGLTRTTPPQLATPRPNRYSAPPATSTHLRHPRLRQAPDRSGHARIPGRNHRLGASPP